MRRQMVTTMYNNQGMKLSANIGMTDIKGRMAFIKKIPMFKMVPKLPMVSISEYFRIS